MKIITICGSLKYKDEMCNIAERYALQGNVVLLPNFPIRDDYSKKEIETLGNMHKEKIKLSSTIIVVNVDNYIGSATSSEIELAQSLGKEILYYTDIIKD